MNESHQTICSYCGIGCVFNTYDEKLKGKKSCSKGVSLTDTLNTNRLIHKNDYNTQIKRIATAIKSTKANKVAFYLSGQMLTEDYYVANKLAKGFIGTPNCDTNSRSCMASAVVGYKKSFGVDYVPVTMEDIDYANLLILIGSNTAESHVVLHNQIKKAKKNGLKVVVIDPRETLTSLDADIHLQIDANSDIDLLNLITKKLVVEDKIDHSFIEKYSNSFEEFKTRVLELDSNELLKKTNIDIEQIDNLFNLITSSKNIITAWTMGINQSIQGVDKNLAINNFHIVTGQINKEGSGPFSLTGQSNAMGGREVGGLSTSLAVHLDYSEENCKQVTKFWNAPNLPSKPGLTTTEIIDKAYNGEIDVLIVCHTDPVYHLPNRTYVEQALKNIPLIVEINAYDNSQISKFAHIRLSSLPFGFKDGTQTNLDRNINRVKPFKEDATLLQDWQIFAKLGIELGFKDEFNFTNSEEVFEEYKNMCQLSDDRHLNIFDTSYQKLEQQSFRWGKNLFENNKFMTQNAKANLHFVTNNNLSEQSSKAFPFILLTGRTRDQWHSGSKTNYSKRLLKFKELNFVEISQEDANEFMLKSNDLVRISSQYGNIESKVKITNIKSKHIFVPISNTDINYLTSSNIDPISKQPDYNHTTVKIVKL